ncbi:SDR family NAD(P)-dependent oxidoreductase [Arcobacter sp.]|uniref:SDR family NAD(P)-dependent oxidoreductase n=1 Tax=Arcobacter sp. TaxID=1872629 RepID=UPI003C74F456
MEKTLELKDKVCVITGAGKGIGYETAKQFSQLGCKLALISRNKNDLISLSNELELNECDILIMEGDVSIEETVIEFINKTIEQFGHIDILFNNAGMRFRKEFINITFDEWQKVMTTNVTSTFLMCREVGKKMITQKSGKIINMASIVGTNGLAELVGYGSSKSAIIGLTKSLAIEWAQYSINVNVIAPGFCETSYTENFKKNTDLYNFTLERTPMKKWGSSKDIANSVLFLSSSMSSYITGEIISIDGGWSAW